MADEQKPLCQYTDFRTNAEMRRYPKEMLVADEQVKYTPEDLERSAAIEEAIFDKAQTIEINGEVYRLHESSLISESYAALIAQVRRDTFDQFWDYIAAHFDVPAGKYTPAKLVDALAESVRREERQKAERLAEAAEELRNSVVRWCKDGADIENPYPECNVQEVADLDAVLADFGKGQANEQ